MPAALGLVIALVAGCSGATQTSVLSQAAPPPAVSPSEPPAVEGAAPLGGELADGGARPWVRTRAIDLGALPLATWTPPPDARGFTLASRGEGQGYRMTMQAPLVAEVIVRPGVGMPQMFAAFTGVSFAEGIAPECSAWKQHGTVPAQWAGFSPHGWTDDAVDAELGDGDFSLATCRAVPRLVARARAPAIVSGFAYAFRLKVDSEGLSPDERLIVFLPSGQMVSTTGEPSGSLDESDVGSFTRLSLPLRPGRASAAAVRVSPGAMHEWRDMRRGRIARAEIEERSAEEDLLVEIDVSWYGEKKAGLLSLGLPRGLDPKEYGRAFSD